MESVREFPLLSEISTLSIKNYHDTIVVDLQPHLDKILATASSFIQSHTIPSSAVEMASEIKESASVLHLSSSNVSLKTSGRALTVKEPPLEIVIEHPLDEKSLVNLSRLLGEHTPTSLSQEEATSLIALLGKNQVEHLKIKSTGVRFVFRILEQTFRPLYRLPPQFEYFTGRTEELAALREGRDTVKVIAPRENKSVEEKEDKSISQISGTGGIGKSQLANYHARSQFRDKKYDWVIWMTGGEDDQRAYNNLSSQFADLGFALGLDVKTVKDGVLLRLVYQRLAAKGRGLVVIDDAPNYNAVKSFLPERFEHREMAVLITTRNSHTFESVLTKILLDVFTLHDAKQYIHRLLREMITDADAELLAITLDRYPLALTTAMAYILNNQCSITEYCQRFNTLRAAKKKYLETAVHEDDPYQLEHQKRKRKLEATMNAVVELSLEQVKAICQTEEAFERAIKVLLATTYLAPEAAIPKSLLRGWVPTDKDEIKINEVLDALQSLSLLEEDSQIATYRIHKVLQDTLRLKDSQEITRQRLLEWHKIVSACLDLFDEGQVELDEQNHKSLQVHLIILAQHLSGEPRTDEFLVAESFMHRKAGVASSFQGKDKIAKTCFETALRCYRQMSTQNAQIEADCLLGLGTITTACGEPEVAKRYLNQLLLVVKKIFNEKQSKVNQSNVGRCLMSLGNAILSAGDPKGSIEYFKEALLISKASSGDKHAFVGACLTNLGTATFMCGETKSAIEYYEAALPILKDTAGEKHGSVGLCLSSLGQAFLMNGQPRAAKPHIVKALSILQEAWGEQHADVGRCHMTLGMATLQCGDSPLEAKSHLEIALPILKTTVGAGHVDVGECLANLGVVALSCGDPQAAKSYLKVALPILQLKLGEGHARAVACLTNLLSASIACGDPPQDTKSYSESALTILNTTGSERNADYGKCLAILGGIALGCGEIQKAKDYLVVAEEVLIATMGEQNLDFATCKMNLGLTALSAGDLVSAKESLKKALLLFEDILGKTSAKVAECMMNLGVAHLYAQELSSAEKCFKAALPILIEKLGKEHSAVGMGWMNLGSVTLANDDPKGAKKYFDTALEILRKKLNANHPDLGRCLVNLGQAYLFTGDPKSAKINLEAGLRILELFYLDNNADLLKTCRDLLAQAIEAERAASNKAALSLGSRELPKPSSESIVDLISEDMMPLSSALAFELAEYIYNLEQFRSATIVLSLIIDADPLHAQAQMLKVHCHIASFEFDEAEECIAIAESLNADFNGLTASGELKKVRDNYEGLTTKVQSTKTTQAMDAREKIIFARTLCSIGKPSQALVILNELIKSSLDSNMLGAAYYQISRCHFLNQNWSQAFRFIENSLELKRHPDAEALRLKIIESAHSTEKIQKTLSFLKISEPENSHQFRLQFQ